MQLKNSGLEPGEWLVVKEGAPPDLRPVTITIGNDDYPAFIEENDIMVRFPHGHDRDSVLQVAVNGVNVGRVVAR